MGIGFSKQIKIGAVISYLGIIVNIAAGLIFTPWLVTTIGKSDYALFTLANSLMSMIIIDFGLSRAVSKYVSQYHAEGNEEKVSEFLGTAYVLYIIIDIAMMLVLTIVFFSIDSIYVKLSATEIAKLKVVFIIVAISSLVSFPFVTLNGILNSYGKFIQLKLADIIYRIISILLMSGALFCGFGLLGVVIASAVSGLIIIIYKLVVIKVSIGIKWSLRQYKKEILFLIFKFSLWTTIEAIAGRFVFSIMPSLLGALASSAAIAVFGIVSTIEGYSYTVASAINGMFMPKISSIHVSKENVKTNILNLMITVGKFQYALNGLIVLGFIVVGKEFIILWMGKDYINAYMGVLLTIIPAIFFNSLQIGHTNMVVENKIHIPAIISIVTAVINVGISVILIPKYGEVGACISIFIAFMARSILYVLANKFIMKIDMKAFILKCWLKMTLPIALTLLIGLWLKTFIVVDSWFRVCLVGCVICVIYGAFCYIILSNKTKNIKIHWRNKLK